MVQHFVIVDNPDYLHIIFDEIWNIQTGLDVLQNFAQAIEVHKKDHVLLDIREQKNETTITESYELAKEVARIMSGISVKVAALAKEEDTAMDKFFETVARNRGFQYEVFIEEEDAINWLSGN